jgi:predicted dehydrogenase
MRKMRIWGTEGYASIDFAGRQATLVQPSDEFLSGQLSLDGIDLGQPSSVKDHLFGKVLRVDKVETPGREPLALELEDFVQAVRGHSQPRVGGDDALRAMRLADQVLKSLNAHRWEGEALAPAATQHADARPALQGPHAWRIKSLRQRAQHSGH